ncbi:hypothetical protein ABVT39_008417 [Epinephelus coioides]
MTVRARSSIAYGHTTLNTYDVTSGCKSSSKRSRQQASLGKYFFSCEQWIVVNWRHIPPSLKLHDGMRVPEKSDGNACQNLRGNLCPEKWLERSESSKIPEQASTVEVLNLVENSLDSLEEKQKLVRSYL